MYREGQGVPESYKDAMVWWRKPADQGYVGAHCNLGIVHREGQGVPLSYKEASV